MAEPAIEAKELRKTYVSKRGLVRRRVERVEALRGVSFRVDRGLVYGLLGPNGAGKTTTVKILSTLLLPDSGEAYVGGYSVIDDAQRVREIIGVSLSVERGFFWKLTGRENLKYFGMLRGLHGRMLDERVEEVLELVGLKKLGGDRKLFEEYSLGMKARLSIARALLHDPEILILDEPTLGLDPPSSRHIRGLLVDMAHGKGKTVLITSHNMFEVELICDRVAIINKGRIIAEGAPAELKKMVAHETPVLVEAWRRGVTREAVERILSGFFDGAASVEVDEEGFIRIRILARSGEEEEAIHRAIEALRRIGARIRVAKTLEPSLEDVFIKLTGGG